MLNNFIFVHFSIPSLAKKIFLSFNLILLSSLLLTGCNLNDKKLILATTTSVNDSGLMDTLRVDFEKETGIKMKVISQGTGQAIKTGQDGDADVLFIHDKTSEEKFVKDGYGLQRIEIAYNYFVIVGPNDDPSGIMTMTEKNASMALKQIMDKRSKFVSRGDESGTNKKEMKLWEKANVIPKGDWYISAGKGMGDVLKMSSEMKAYTLTDKATFLAMKDKLDLKICLEDSIDLLNQYSVIAVNPKKHPEINNDEAQKFIEWLTIEKTLKSINDFGKEKFGESLFKVNYTDKK